jgi:hypothetical protein
MFNEAPEGISDSQTTFLPYSAEEGPDFLSFSTCYCTYYVVGL